MTYRDLIGFVCPNLDRRDVLHHLVTYCSYWESELAKELGLDVSEVSKILAELEDHGLVEGNAPTHRGYKVNYHIWRGGYLYRKIKEEIDELFFSAGVHVAHNMVLKGDTFDLKPEFVVFDNEGPALAVKIFVPELKLEHMALVDKANLSGIFAGYRSSLESLAVKCHEIKKHNSIPVAIVLPGTRKRAPKYILDFLDALVGKYFDHIFFEDETAELSSYVEKSRVKEVIG